MPSGISGFLSVFSLGRKRDKASKSHKCIIPLDDPALQVRFSAQSRDAAITPVQHDFHKSTSSELHPLQSHHHRLSYSTPILPNQRAVMELPNTSTTELPAEADDRVSSEAERGRAEDEHSSRPQEATLPTFVADETTRAAGCNSKPAPNAVVGVEPSPNRNHTALEIFSSVNDPSPYHASSTPIPIPTSKPSLYLTRSSAQTFGRSTERSKSFPSLQSPYAETFGLPSTTHLERQFSTSEEHVSQALALKQHRLNTLGFPGTF